MGPMLYRSIVLATYKGDGIPEHMLLLRGLEAEHAERVQPCSVPTCIRHS